MTARLRIFPPPPADPAPASQTMTGTVADWEKWTGLALPATGTYVIPDGLTTLAVDRAADTGLYIEPNIWMRHR